MDLDTLSWKKIILFRTDRLGDVILSLPVVESLKAFLPQAQIDLFVNSATASLAKLQRNVSHVFTDVYHGTRGFVEFVRFLRGQHYDVAIHLYPRPRVVFATFLARVPVRVGTMYRYYSLLLNRRIKIRRKHMVMHELDLNLKLIKGIGIPTTPVSYGLVIPQQAQAEIHGLLLSKGIDLSARGLVILHPGSGGSSLNWPTDHYGHLGKRLVAMGFSVVLTGTETDRSVISQVQMMIGERVFDVCSTLDLEHLAALLSMASLVISNSTGPLHLADALGKKVIGLYSPFFFSSPIRWGPYTQMENVFVPDRKSCHRCTRDRCKDYNCMSLIRPEDVLERALKLLSSDT